MKKKKLNTHKKLSNYLDGLIRTYFKLTYGDNPECFVCGHRDWWYHPKNHRRGIQVGHYVSRKIGFLRWDLKNVFPQCSGCNRIHTNNPAPFTMAILKKIGQERIDYLNSSYLKNKGTRISMGFRRQVQYNLEAEINKLQKELD